MPVHPRSRLHRRKRFNDFAQVKPPHVKSVFSMAFLLYLMKKYRKQLLWAFGIFLLILLLIPVFTYIYFAGDLKDKNSITNRSKTGLTLLDREGEVFFTFYQPKTVTYISLSEIPTSAQDAVVATEDKNFYTNPGFSVTGMSITYAQLNN